MSLDKTIAQPGGKPPFFVLGSQRSGTTMLRLMLNNHPNLAVPHETAFITLWEPRVHEYGPITEADTRRRMLADIMGHKLVERGELVRAEDVDTIVNTPVDDYAGFVNVIMRAYAARSGKARWGDKTPFYSRDVDVLRCLFPDCKIIHIVRDPRDVILSQLRMEWMSSSVARLATDWRWVVTLLHKVGAVLGPDYLEIRYEDLVDNPEPVLRRICEHLGEPYAPEILDYNKSSKDVVPEHSLRWHSNSVQAPQKAKIGQWRDRMSIPDRNIIEQIAGDAMEIFGYERENRPHGPRTKLRKLYFALVKRW